MSSVIFVTQCDSYRYETRPMPTLSLNFFATATLNGGTTTQRSSSSTQTRTQHSCSAKLKSSSAILQDYRAGLCSWEAMKLLRVVVIALVGTARPRGCGHVLDVKLVRLCCPPTVDVPVIPAAEHTVWIAVGCSIGHMPAVIDHNQMCIAPHMIYSDLCR